MNEYEILLSYLDKQKKVRKPEELIKVKSFEDIEAKKIAESTSNTKKILEECQEKEILDTPQPSNFSEGFDTEKFENLMRSRLIDDYKKMQSYERPYISVTELFYCLRKSYYGRLKYQTDLKKQFNFAYLDLINRVANTIHEYVQEIYNFTETEKTLVSEKYRVKGRIDALSDSFLYELKTLDEKKFTGRYIKEHYYQAIIYAHILNSEYNYNIKTITIVYFFRDALKRKPVPFDLPINDKVAIEFLEQATLLHSCILGKEVPEPINSNEEQCRWCPYISFCEKDASKMDKPFSKKQKKIITNEKTIDVEIPKEEKRREAVFLL